MLNLARTGGSACEELTLSKVLLQLIPSNMTHFNTPLALEQLRPRLRVVEVAGEPRTIRPDHDGTLLASKR